MDLHKKTGNGAVFSRTALVTAIMTPDHHSLPPLSLCLDTIREPAEGPTLHGRRGLLPKSRDSAEVSGWGLGRAKYQVRSRRRGTCRFGKGIPVWVRFEILKTHNFSTFSTCEIDRYGACRIFKNFHS